MEMFLKFLKKFGRFMREKVRVKDSGSHITFYFYVYKSDFCGRMYKCSA